MRLLTGSLLVFMLSIALATSSGHRDAVADEGKVNADDIPVTTVYKLHDLPVWTAEKRFDPTVLMHLIQATVSPSDWEADGGGSTLAPYPQNASLVISTHPQNHHEIRQLLKTMRRKGDAE